MHPYFRKVQTNQTRLEWKSCMGVGHNNPCEVPGLPHWEFYVCLPGGPWGRECWRGLQALAQGPRDAAHWLRQRARSDRTASHLVTAGPVQRSHCPQRWSPRTTERRQHRREEHASVIWWHIFSSCRTDAILTCLLFVELAACRWVDWDLSRSLADPVCRGRCD